MTSALAARLTSTYERIASAAEASGRHPESVRLVCVSKGHGPDAIREAYACGARLFGESYAQELSEKAAALADLDGLEFHYIGRLQSNKAKAIANVVTGVHSVDDARLARALGRHRRGAPLDVLVQVNVAGEAQKGGVSEDALEPLLLAVENEPALRLRGLMTLPPFGDPRSFAKLATLRERFGRARLPELSMGMSDDLEAAIACGATMVRIGTAIFGERGLRPS